MHAVLMRLHVPFIEGGFARFLQSRVSKSSRAPFWVVEMMLEKQMDQP